MITPGNLKRASVLVELIARVEKWRASGAEVMNTANDGYLVRELGSDARNRIAVAVDLELRALSLGYKDALAGYGVDVSNIKIAALRATE